MNKSFFVDNKILLDTIKVAIYLKIDIHLQKGIFENRLCCCRRLVFGNLVHAQTNGTCYTKLNSVAEPFVFLISIYAIKRSLPCRP